VKEIEVWTLAFHVLKSISSRVLFLVIKLLEVNSITLHNPHYIVLALCKAARPAQIKEKIEILVL
jgi:hypothetical protein